MKILITFLLGVTLAYSGFSQQTNYDALKPAELVTESKKLGNQFDDVSIFKFSSADNATATKALTTHKSLTLNVGKLKQLTLSTPGQLTFKVPSAADKNLDLELVQVEIFDKDFAVIESSTNLPTHINRGVHYRGIIKGMPNSMASISIFEDEVVGLISSSETGNLVLARLKESGTHLIGNKQNYVLYNDEDVIQQLEAYCATPDDAPSYTTEQLEYLGGQDGTAGNCVRIYFEIDHDIYTEKEGTAGAVNYISAIFNQCATLYANENVSLVVSQMYVWDTPSPYSSNFPGKLLEQFGVHRTVFNGDLAQLVSYQASGGVAYLGGLCHSSSNVRMSFASVNSTFTAVPTYSFSVMVMAHEFGHLLGSNHTHACVWNGNNTAIDGCAGVTEGNCSTPGIPPNGGTIMSYCHITSAGVDFNLGFGAQPGNVIRNMVANAPCLQPCNNNEPTPTCNDNKLFLTLVIDDYASENSWDLKSATGMVLYSSSSFPKASAGLIIKDTLCVVDGCYKFTLYDSYGDGICCDYGNGSYQIKDAAGNILVANELFSHEKTSNFCINVDTNASSQTINFADFSINSHGGGQDVTGVFQLLENNTVLKISNNAWKSITLPYEVTPHTVITFDFRSTSIGEVHGIGFDNDDIISEDRTFKVHGLQNWGIQTPINYTGDGEWQSFSIPVGEFYQGTFNRLFFVADHDSGQHNGNSFFKNVVIEEKI